ncbi:hypothetical protein E8E01_15080 [Methylorubrum populi]|uniref:hypothetical protein n=1 Tax=Methylorubrum populi TaxID=223967 RepID=UPI001152EF23|nr:hypothetical protein [Methylorubrum populi]QDI81674.1 hypothetical protein E8E01_15080 [Methylorubrum populi]
MSLDPATLDAMVAAGFSAQQIATVVKAELMAERAKLVAADEARRAKAADKKRRQRAEARLVSLDVSCCPGDNEGQPGTQGDSEGQAGTAGDAAVDGGKEGPQTPKETTHSKISPSAPKGASVPKGTERRRGCRIPDGFERSDEALQVAADFGLTGDAAVEALAEFADYWRSLPGLKATKLDWLATLRNRLREVARRRPAARASPHRPRSSNGFYDILRDEPVSPDDQRSDPQRQHLRLAAGGRQ